jgi:competence protein ComEC
VGLPFLLLAYILGVGCAPFLSLAPYWTTAPFLIAPLWLLFRSRRGAAVLLLAFFFTLGLFLYQLRIAPPRNPDHLRAFIGNYPVTVEGLVLSVSNRAGGRSVIDLDASGIVSEGIAAPTRGRLRLYLAESNPPVTPGDAIRFICRLRAPRPFGTPGEFDFPRHLASRDIFVTAFLPVAQGIANLGPRDAGGLITLVGRRRSAIAGLIDRSLEPSLAPLVRALVIGDQGGVSPEQRELLGRAGISHLFAISGMHLGLVAVFLYAAGLFFYRRSETLLRLGPPRRFLPPLLLPLLWAYLLLTGGTIPTVRAFLMTLAGAMLFLGARRTPPLKLLTATAFLILCLDPLVLFEPSFQLSFAGVAGIMVLLPRWQVKLVALPRALRWTATLQAVTLAASVATAPLVLLHFHLLAPAGLPANLVAVPAIGFAAVPLGLAGALLSPFWPAAAAAAFQGCGLVVQTLLSVAGWIVELPLLAGWRIYASPPQTIAAFFLAATVLLHGTTRRRRYFKVALLVAGGLCLLWQPRFSGLTVTALSVGQGDAILLSLEGGRHYLVDGGGLHSETFDVGERLLAPALGWLGIGSLEAVILTHDDLDHRQGLLHAMEHFPAHAFWSPIPLEELHPSLKEVLVKRRIPAIQFPTGWTVIEETDRSTLALFAPPQRGSSHNDASLVLYARHGSEGVLLTGDLEAPGVSALLAANPPTPVTLLKLPHHGSDRSSPELLLDRFGPALAFVSVGAGNPYHLPNAKAIDALRQRNIPLFRTDRQGSLRFLTNGSGWESRHWQRGLFR